ncbi:hypothetical protein [Maribacter sp. IgM3_T14_3]|uniref:hypothetical protein n=1 Tax=Maribacter sp. IgM3_T14_3 TaxID=3415140 RepID=UPI003C6F83C0
MKPMKKSSLWLIAASVSLIAILVIANKWAISFNANDIHHESDKSINVVHDASEMEAYFKTWEGRGQNKPNTAIRIPTGFFIQSISFQSPNEVNFTGIIWQKIPLDVNDSIIGGFDFPKEKQIKISALNDEIKTIQRRRAIG